jgi:hypothetical protein
MKINFAPICSRNLGFKAILYSLLATLAIISPAAAQKETQPLLPTVRTAIKSDVSPPLRSIKPKLTGTDDKGDDDRGEPGPVNDTRHDPDPVLQRSKGKGVFTPDNLIPPTGVSFDGLVNAGTTTGPVPPDTIGDIGTTHYVQMVNSRFQVFTRNGTSVYGPANINTLFTGFGGACETENAGDPVVLYDQMANRWLLTQFTAAGPTFFNCVALSTTADPTGTYQRYAFQAGSAGANFPDYPKYGVWSDGYYFSTREFVGAGGPFAGVGAYALNRTQMLAGSLAPQVVSFLVPPGANDEYVGDGLLPTDLDGTTLPPAGRDNYFIGTMDAGGPYGAATDALNVFRFKVDWTTPANSTFTLTDQLPTAAFDSVFPCTPNSRDCIPQPGTTAKIDILSSRQRPTFRLAYRRIGTQESLVTSQSVEASPSVAGMRWYEVRLAANGTPSIFQQGTYAPDSVHRWMGSVAMDRIGNMGLGYSVSDGTNVFPGVRYTGRLSTDPTGMMPQGEGTIVNGGGSQTTTAARWGDYSSMNIDPVDDCTFWYTTQYYAATSARGWRTRIGSFKFPSCTPSASSAGVSGRIVSSAGRSVRGVRVTLSGGNLSNPKYAQTNASGYYRFAAVPVGENYVLSVFSKQYAFDPAVRPLNVTEEVTNADFIAEPRK